MIGVINMDQKTGAPEPFDDEIECARYDESIPYSDPRWDIDVQITIPGLRKWRYGPGGALTTNFPITGVTQLLDEKCERFYGFKYFVGEAINEKACMIIAKSLCKDTQSIETYELK